MVYPESAPPDWMEMLKDTYLAFAISPLHDKDANPDGEVKKAHYHVILAWDGPQRKTAAKRIADFLNAPNPIKIESVKGAYRYFTHKDNPEKFQYDEQDIKLFNGFDISSHIVLTRKEKYEAVSEIKRIIRERQIVEYIDLLDELESQDYNLFEVACDNTILTNALVRSMRHSKNKRG